MTFRSILLGLIGALCLCAVGFFNDQIMHNAPLVADYFPLSIFGLLILFLLTVNRWLGKGRAGGFTAAELAVMVTLPLLVGWIPGRAFMRYFDAVLVMPHRFAVERPGWQASPTDYTVSDIRDPARLIHSLSAQQADEATRIITAALPPETRNALLSLSGSSNLPPDIADSILSTLNQTLSNPDLFRIAMQNPDELPVNLRSRLATLKTGSQTVSGERAASPRSGAADPPADTINESDRRVAVRSHLDFIFTGALEPRWPALLENVSPDLLVSTNSNFATVVDGFRSGLGQEQSHASVRDIPWQAWVTPYRQWIPGILLFSLLSIGLAMAVHREWSEHEHLPYPSISFIEALLPTRTGETNSTFRQRLFWVSFILITGIHLYNYTSRAWGHYQYLVPLSLRFDFGPIADMFPILKFGQSWVVFSPRIFFVVVGLAYFLTSEVSLSLAISPIIYLFVLGMAASYGVSFGGDAFAPDIETFIYGGAYLGLFLVVLWTGRHYYRRIFIHATIPTHRSTDDRDRLAINGARVALLATGLLTLWMIHIGVEWPLAIMCVLILIATHIVMARVLAEGGVIWFGPSFVPSALLWGFFGARAIGPDQLLLLGLVSSMLMMNPTVALMPFASSAIRLLDRAQAPIGKTLAWGGVALVAGLAVALAVTLYTEYDRGVTRINDSWATQTIPPKVYDANLITRHRLDAQGLLHTGNAGDMKFQISNFKLEKPAVAALCVTVSLVLLFTYFRHRFTNWPLHPILFIALGTWPSAWLGFSFFLGWLAKTAVTRYGGASLYHRLKPLMIGMIAGEMVGVTIPAILSAIYYLATGEPGVHYTLIPH